MADLQQQAAAQALWMMDNPYGWYPNMMAPGDWGMDTITTDSPEGGMHPGDAAQAQQTPYNPNGAGTNQDQGTGGPGKGIDPMWANYLAKGKDPWNTGQKGKPEGLWER